ncbi:MAG: RsmE family RNA methyltransferase [Acidimicrobiales bacterium]
MRRATALCYVTDLEAPEVSPEDAHHLVAVRRVRDGELVVASDGRGSWRPCRARGAGSRARARSGSAASLLLEPDGSIKRDPAPSPLITIGLSLVKGDRTEWAAAKCAELGVDRIVLLLCERTVIRMPVRMPAEVAAEANAKDGDIGRRRSIRLERVAREAAMQARRTWLPLLRGPLAFADALSAGVALAEPGGAPPGLTTPSILVGPEGGWSEVELEAARSAGHRRVSLGGTILRTETAAVAAATVLAALRSGIVVSPPARSEH